MNIFRHFFYMLSKISNKYVSMLHSSTGWGTSNAWKKRNKIFILFHKPSFSILIPFYTVKCHIYFCAPNKLIPSFFSTPHPHFTQTFFSFAFFLLHFHALLDSTLLCSYICSTLALAISVKMFHRFEPFFCFSFFSSFFNFSSFRSRFFSFQFVSFWSCENWRDDFGILAEDGILFVEFLFAKSILILILN